MNAAPIACSPASAAATPALARLFEEIGRDRALSIPELPYAMRAHAATRDFWTIYDRHWRRHCAARLDPLFCHLDHPARWTGCPDMPPGAAVVVVGTGPSLAGQIGRLRHVRDSVYLFTSPRGAEVLLASGITPDLVLVEHQSPLDAHVSVNRLRDRRESDRNVLQLVPLVAAAPNTPCALLAGVDCDRLFVPEPWPTWGLWPATAVALAIAYRAGSIQLLGIDLGSRDRPDASQAPLRDLLAVLARYGDTDCRDSGPDGCLKPGWPKRPVGGGPAVVLPPLNAPRQQWLEPVERRRRARAAFERAAHHVEYARVAFAAACRVRDGDRSASAVAAAVSALEILRSWSDIAALRWDLEEVFGLSFLPRLWRVGVAPRLGAQAWRPVTLVAHELVRQADALETTLSEETP